MLRSPSSLIVQPTSGFVPFSGGGTVAGELDVEPHLREWMPAAPRVAGAPAVSGMRRTVWAPGTAAQVRGVEALVLASVCAYFSFGLGKLLGLL
jgi:hypothetical protein